MSWLWDFENLNVFFGKLKFKKMPKFETLSALRGLIPAPFLGVLIAQLTGGLGTGPLLAPSNCPGSPHLRISRQSHHTSSSHSEKESSRLETLNSLASRPPCVLTVYSLQVRHNDVGPTHSCTLIVNPNPKKWSDIKIIEEKY